METLKLSNGATLIAYTENDMGRRYVAARYNGEFVTWVMCENGGCHHGNYIGFAEEDRKAAIKDMHKRAGTCTVEGGAA